jgi:signal transduction histidine kinase
MKKVIVATVLILSGAIFFNQTSFCQSKPERTSSAQDSQGLVVKSQVETAISMLQTIFSKHQNGELTLAQAKKLGADLLRELRYGQDGYFWADTTEGVNVVLYGQKNVEGKSRLNVRDSKGKYFVKDFIATAKAGGGYEDYWFPKMNQTNFLPKRAYVQLFEPFGWVIGSGYYLATDAGIMEETDSTQALSSRPDQIYQDRDTRELVALVNDATELVRTKGEAAFSDFRVSGSRWRQGETYIFVLDPNGNMVVHPDPGLEGKNQISLTDINGKPIIRGIVGAATMPSKPQGWYHYQWFVPGEILPRWKSTYVELVEATSGKSYLIGSGIYNDRMERAFVQDAVKGAVGEIEKNGRAAFPVFRDPKGPFVAKRAYIFVIDSKGIDLVNPGFPSLEGRNMLDVKDTQGKQPVREMLNLVQTSGSGWVNYMWPKPGDSVSTRKSSYVSKAKLGEEWVLVGCGVYLADAPTTTSITRKMTAPELRALVQQGAKLLEAQGEKAYPEFRKKGSKWFTDSMYFIVYAVDGSRVFNAADPKLEGQNVSSTKDVLGRPYGKMFLDVGASPSGEGWVHYMYPEPGDIFPTWKSTFVKRVTFPSGKKYIIGSGIYNMQTDRDFVQDLVDRAAALVAERGKEAFGQLRDKTGPFVYLDNYVFVDTPDGTELVNPAQPSMEGKNLINLKDIKGKAVAKEYIAAAMKDGSGWVDYYWYKPGSNTSVRKEAYVRKVQSGQDIYILGSGLYTE